MTRRRQARRRPRLATGGLVGCLALSIGLAGCAAESEDFAEDDQVVTVFGPWRDETATHFREALSAFEERTGLDVVYSGSGSFSTDVTRRLRDGLTPDVIMFPQPGTMLSLAEDGFLVPVRDDVRATAEASHRPAVRAAAEQLTETTGVLYRLNVKSLVWYPPAVFAEAGYAVPASWSELEALTERIQADGSTPWCMGVESFSASGWPATDWVEDLLLRSATLEEYDAWTRGDLPFTDPLLGEALTDFESLVLEPGRVVGGRRGVLNTPATQAQQPMFDSPAGCLLYRQASFASDALEDQAVIGPDGVTDVFVLPSRTDDDPPLLVGGTFAAPATDRPETWALMDYLASPEGSQTWVERGGFVSPHRTVTARDYPDAFDRRVAGLLETAEDVRFDGSDLMPPEVGSGTFLWAMLTFIATSGVSDSLAIAQSGWDRSSADAAETSIPTSN